ncbi:MAG: lamin tail domain-containing protein [Dehalococcoidia bacterium]
MRPITLAGILLTALAIGLTTEAVNAQRLPPHRFFGTVTLNGSVPPVGTRVEAAIDGRVCGVGQTSSGGNYVVDVDHQTSTPGCGRPGATVTFRVNGQTATPTGVFRDGGYERLDITAAGGGGRFSMAALSLSDPRPCIPDTGQNRCDATREALWNGEESVWSDLGVTDPDARFNETVVYRIRAGDPAVISIIARFLGAPYLQVTRVRFVGTAAGQADEYAEVSNLGGGDQEMGGWTLRSPLRGQLFRFPAGFVMTAGRTCRVYTGAPQENSCGLAGFAATDVWPDDAGQVVLFFDALALPGADVRYNADPNNQPPPPNLQGVS